MDSNRINIGEIHLGHSPNCFVESLRATLNHRLPGGRYFVDRHLSFLYWNDNPGDFKKFYVSSFLIDDLLDAVNELDEISFAARRTDNIYQAEEELVKSLKNGIPVMVFVDTFFLEFFPKKQGHEVHLLVASKLNQKNVFVSSSLPYSGWVPLEKISVARHSRINERWIRNTWFEILYPAHDEELSLKHVPLFLRANINQMKKGEATKCGRIYGIHGIEMFRNDLAIWLDNAEQKILQKILQELFSQLLFLVDQRKRFVGFLGYISNKVNFNLSSDIEIYTKIAKEWEIFRNLCFKASKGLLMDTSRLAKRLALLIDLEKEGLMEIEKSLNQLGNV